MAATELWIFPAKRGSRGGLDVAVLIAKNEKTDQTKAQFKLHSNAHKPEVPVGHSQMLKTRRAKQRTRKDLAGIAKRAKKLGKQTGKVLSADAKAGALP
jgi:hypothetical protein